MVLAVHAPALHRPGYAQVVEESTGATPATLSRVYTCGLDLVSQRQAPGGAQLVACACSAAGRRDRGST